MESVADEIYIFVYLTTDLRVISCDLSDHIMKHRVWACVDSLHNAPLLTLCFKDMKNKYYLSA